MLDGAEDREVDRIEFVQQPGVRRPVIAYMFLSTDVAATQSADLEASAPLMCGVLDD